MNNYLKNISLFSVLTAATINIAACALDTPTENQITVQAIAPEGNAQKQKLYNYLLNERGVNVINMGETRTIVIASDSLFVAGSANFNPEYVRYLKIVAQLINSYDTTSVAVTAYTNQSGDATRALTENQAQKVLAYLKKNGVDTRLIYAKGYGNLYPVSIGAHNSQFNRRIEIKFQFNQEQKV